jgi:trans-aconitate methyltransferase
MDLGCGSGHFTLPFSRMLSPYKGRVLGIDRSSAMLASLEDAVMRHSINNVSLIHSDFCCYEPLEQISVFFASEVLHACDDLSAVFTHASSLGCPGSMFVIRTPSHDQLRQIRWLSFFEGALELDLARTVDIAVMCDHLRRAGFDQNVQVEVIHEAHAISSLSFLSALEDKAYSLLRVLPSAEFAKGLQRASQYCAGKLSINNNLNMTCIRARRP